MSSRTVKELMDNLYKAYKESDKYLELWKTYAYQGKKNLASANRANCALASSKINKIKKEIRGKLNQPAYKIKLLVKGKPCTGFLTNINKDEIPYLYEITAKLNKVEIKILEIEEIHPYLFKE